MDEKKVVRVDKFLWAVRIFKTRTMATDACRMGRVLIGNNPVKPSKYVECEDIINIRKPPATYTFKVLKVTENRVSASLVSNFVENLTDENEIFKLKINRTSLTGYRERGMGRPTKKERRSIDKWRDGLNADQRVV